MAGTAAQLERRSAIHQGAVVPRATADGQVVPSPAIGWKCQRAAELASELPPVKSAGSEAAKRCPERRAGKTHGTNMCPLLAGANVCRASIRNSLLERRVPFGLFDSFTLPFLPFYLLFVFVCRCRTGGSFVVPRL